MQLVDWTNQKLHEPPATRSLSEDEIKEYMDSDIPIEFPPYPCHTQGTERYVQVVANSQNVSEKNVDGFIKNKITSQKKRPRFETKSDYKL